jgi:hypothetical protein
MRSRRGELRRRAARNADFGSLQQTFLLSAVATILVIRTQLWLTNYPQLGGGGLHIAHLLWGGLFMVIAIGLLLTFIGRWPRQPAAIIGGIGFGFFIDELGKFITADNNYFFRPAAPIIYVIFIGLFLLSGTLRRHGGLTPGERLLNALDRIGEEARHDFDENDRRQTLELLKGADPNDPLVTSVRRLAHELDALPPPEPPWLERRALALRDTYFRLVERSWFQTTLVWLLAIWALGSLLSVIALVFPLGFEVGVARAGFRSDDLGDLEPANFLSLASSTASAVLVVIGVRALRTGRRLDAYRAFDRALLVSIFLTRVVAFVESQFGAVFGLALDVLLLVTVRYMTAQERRGTGAGVRERPSAATPEAATSAPLRAPGRLPGS